MPAAGTAAATRVSLTQFNVSQVATGSTGHIVWTPAESVSSGTDSWTEQRRTAIRAISKHVDFVGRSESPASRDMSSDSGSSAPQEVRVTPVNSDRTEHDAGTCKVCFFIWIITNRPGHGHGRTNSQR